MAMKRRAKSKPTSNQPARKPALSTAPRTARLPEMPETRQPLSAAQWQALYQVGRAFALPLETVAWAVVIAGGVPRSGVEGCFGCWMHEADRQARDAVINEIRTRR